MKVQRIERQPGGGLRVTLADGSGATYASSASLPDDVAVLLTRMDSANGGKPQSNAGAARDAYRQRLEQASPQTGQPAPHQGLGGRDRYLSELQHLWQQLPPAKARVRNRNGALPWLLN